MNTVSITTQSNLCGFLVVLVILVVLVVLDVPDVLDCPGVATVDYWPRHIRERYGKSSGN